MLQDKIQKFQEETLRENTLKTQAKCSSIFNWHKSDENEVFVDYMWTGHAITMILWMIQSEVYGRHALESGIRDES